MLRASVVLKRVNDLLSLNANINTIQLCHLHPAIRTGILNVGLT